MAISLSETVSSEALQRLSYISYPVQFEESQVWEIRALIDSGSKINAMTPLFAAELDLSIRDTSIVIQKIDGSALKTYIMTIARFLLYDILGKIWFFEETFLLADTSIDMVLEMFFISLSNANV